MRRSGRWSRLVSGLVSGRLRADVGELTLAGVLVACALTAVLAAVTLALVEVGGEDGAGRAGVWFGANGDGDHDFEFDA